MKGAEPPCKMRPLCYNRIKRFQRAGIDMLHSDDAYAAMLLTMALSPNREEYARPLSIPEFRRVEALARGSGFGSIGALLDVDISGLVMLLGFMLLVTFHDIFRLVTG